MSNEEDVFVMNFLNRFNKGGQDDDDEGDENEYRRSDSYE
jgi:hypothetical protein